MQGNIEAISRSHIRGWVANPASPAETLRVELLVDGRSVSSAAVEDQRPDLAVLRLGRTDFGFTLPVPNASMLDLKRMAVRVSGTDYLLPLLAGAAQYEGVIDHFSGGAIGGWAWQAGRPDRPVVLALVRNGQRLKTFKAEVFREDLAKLGIGDGRHGFLVSLDDAEGASNNPDGIEVVFDANGEMLPDVRGLLRTEAPPEAPPAYTPFAAPPPPSPVSRELAEAIKGAIDFDDQGDLT